MRSRAVELGTDFVIHFVDASEAVLMARLVTRNANLPQGAFRIPESKFKRMGIDF